MNSISLVSPLQSETICKLDSQVGGHPGVLTTEDGSLIIKPALPLELQFYQALNHEPVYEHLRPFVPKFIGTLKLEGKLDDSKSLEDGRLDLTPVSGQELQDLLTMPDFSVSYNLPVYSQAVVLENLAFPFLRPNVLDIKLGTVLYDQDTSPKKVEHKKRKAQATTLYETGMCLTGFQVHDNYTALPIVASKVYCKSTKVPDLQQRIARCFPVGTPPIAKDASFPESSQGLPPASLLPIVTAIHDEIAQIRQVLSKLEIRMVGASLLIIHEADWARAEEGIARLLAGQEKEYDGDGRDDDGSDDNDSDESDSERPGPPYVVKIIDFAHTRIMLGQGPDLGVLKGVDTVLRLLKERMAEIKAML